MKSEWKKIKAKDFIEFNPKITLKKGTVSKKIAMDKLSPFSKKIYDYEISSYSGGTKFCNDDTIMARITPCLENGKTAYIDFLEDDEVAFGSTEFIVLRAKKGISNSQFIYYLSISPKFRDIAIKSMVGSSGRQRVQQSVLEELELIVPPLKEQEKIGAFLKNIDDKIELNQQINNNLEQQAQAIYYEWFEKYSKYNLSSENRLVKLGDLVNIQKKTFNPSKEDEVLLEHYSIPAFDEAKFPIFELSTEIKSNKYVIDKDCFMISKLNPTTKRVWKPYCISKQSVCSTEFIVYKAKNIEMTDFLFSVINSPSFSDFMCSHVTGSTGSRQRTTPSDTLNFEFILPSNDEINNFTEIVKPIYIFIKNNYIEIDKLKRIRDNLLPKLMSGEIDISEVNI